MIFLKPFSLIKPYFITSLIISFILAVPFISVSEYYQYVNEDGVICFTDDMGRIPENQVDKVVVHKEKYDGLDEEEKKLIINREKAEIEAIRKKQNVELNRYDMLNRIQQVKKDQIARKKRLEKMITPVHISNNQILVPVTLGYSDRTVSATLLLDTGANKTLIYDSIAKELNITRGKKVVGRVANGDKIRAKWVNLQFIQVGPKKLNSPTITVCKYKGPQGRFNGLLGLDFLKNFQYTIDYENQAIKWEE